MTKLSRLPRWYVKKAARKALALSSSASGLIATRGGVAGDPCLRVLTYHRFGDAHRDPFCVELKDFTRQMAWLARHECAVSFADMEAFLAGKKTLPDGAVLVTVDDGFRSLYAEALPVLRQYGIPAVAFVPAGEIADADREPAHASGELPERRLTWSELATLSAAGLVIGSHAWTHRSLAQMPASEIRDQAERSRATLAQRTGQPVTAFAYPFGTRADYNATSTQVLRESGYTCAFTSQHGAVRTGVDFFTLPRVKVEGGEAAWMFPLLCLGALDGWRWVDRTLWRLQERAG